MKKLSFLISVFAVLISQQLLGQEVPCVEKLDSIITQKYVDGFPRYFSKVEMKYTPSGAIEEETKFFRSPDNTSWLPFSNQKYKYNENGLKERQDIQVWDLTANNWKTLNKVYYHYNSEGQLSAKEVYFFEVMSATWWVYSMEKIDYTPSGLKQKVETEYWSGNYPVYSNFTEYFYHEDDQLDLILSSTTLFGNLRRSQKEEFVYDEQMHPLGKKTFAWNQVTSSFKLIDYAAYTSDKHGNVIELEEKTYNFDNELIAVNKKEVAYNKVVSIKGIATNGEELLDAPYCHKIQAIQYKEDIKLKGEFKNTFTELFFYSPNNPQGLFHVALSLDLKVYPNPATRQISFATPDSDFQSFEVVDMHGHQVMEGQLLFQMNQLDISGLPTGTYILRLKGKSEFLQGRFTKR